MRSSKFWTDEPGARQEAPRKQARPSATAFGSKSVARGPTPNSPVYRAHGSAGQDFAFRINTGDATFWANAAGSL